MKLYEFTIKPVSGFGTALKGDTLFGHFCWQVVHDHSLINGENSLTEEHKSLAGSVKLANLLQSYEKKPFAIFSSAFPRLAFPLRYALKKPDLPQHLLFADDKTDCKEHQRKIKEKKKKKWMLVEGGANLSLLKAGNFKDDDLLNPKELLEKISGTKTENSSFLRTFVQPHNSINRLTNTTGTDPFAPYVQESVHYYPETELVIFVLIDESATDADRIRLGLERIGKWGYGRDASIGMGRFTVVNKAELTLPDASEANAIYTLAPSVPLKGAFSKAWFTPFTRFGKHGDKLASRKNPFKNPVIMADEGAVFEPADRTCFEKPYWGQAIRNVSKSQENTVVQGYAPYLPLKMERMS